MNRTYSIGLMLASSAALMYSCTNAADIISESQPVQEQQQKQEVSITCFTKETVDLGTRAGSPISLQETNAFTELEVALIPVGAEDDTPEYIVRQDNTQEDFGKVKLQVPGGTYYMVAIAANTADLKGERVIIHSTSKVTFPNDTPSDMVYTYKQITVDATKSTQTYDATMTRGVSAFKLQASDYAPLNIASEKVTITGNCGRAFNPSTGHCVTTDGMGRHPSFDPSKYTGKNVNVRLYTFLADDDVSNLQVDAQAFDKNGNIVRSHHFDDVHLEKGKMTIYTGPIFTTNVTASFTIDTAEMEQSGYSKEF